MGKLSEIPKLRAVLAERTQRLLDEKAGVSDAAAARMGLATSDEFNKRAPRTEDDVFRDLVETAQRKHHYDVADALDRATRAMIQAGPADHGGMNCRTALTEPVEVNAALLAENDRLTRQVAELQADIRRRTTRFNPASRREEPWDPIATLEDISAQVPRDRRFEGYTLAGAVKEMAKALAEAEKRPTSAEIDAALADVLLKQAKLEPGMLVALRAGEDTDPKILRRMAEALNKALTDRYGSMTYGAPTVLMLPPDAIMETVPTNGRGPVQVNVHPEGHPKKPTDVPKHVARAYAEAAAASYGVTPEVVQAKRKARRERSTVVTVPAGWRPSAPESPFITPEIRNEHRTIGRDIIAYDDPADLMCADAPDAEG